MSNWNAKNEMIHLLKRCRDRPELFNNQPRPEAVVLGRPPEGAVYVRLPPLGAWSWSGPGFS